ncbi:MAG: ABC transporter ATP-binding protein [Acidimicrobiia bacterium]|nr:ABC transporter ATP-binding protein [Acidimicrobiia bacterium]
MLSLVDLHKRFGEVTALDGAGFDVEPGRIVGFLGPNGAGKTTAMRCVFDLVEPDSGTVTWGGRPITHEDRLSFGYMPEERGLYPKMKIGEQLSYFGRLSGLSRSDAAGEAAAWLERLGLAERALSKLEELSHGNQQRVQLAASLVHRPQLAVLDEPFSGLDPIGVEAMADIIRSLAGSGMGVVFSSHQLDLVEDVCQDVVIIDRGRVMVSGTLDELKDRSEHLHLEVTVDGKEWDPQLADAIYAGNSRASNRYLVDRDVDVTAILERARAAGTVTQFSVEPPRLSDIFREAVQR